jgi:hypothetical protein
MRGMWVFVVAAILLAPRPARGDERMDLGLMLGSTNATDASSAPLRSRLDLSSDVRLARVVEP